MKRFTIILTVLICLICTTFGQQRKLQVGDTLPKLIITNLLNFPSKNFAVPRSGKWLMLEFWNTNCTACVAAFPRIQQLQNEFYGKIEWLFVAYQPRSKIAQFLQKRKKLTGMDVTLPIACGDSLLTSYFQPEGFPYCVWVDTSGVIKSITDGHSVNRRNILAMLKNKDFQMDQVVDSLMMVDIEKPLFINGNGGDESQMMWSSTLSKYIHGLPWASGTYPISNGRSITTILNASIKGLYQYIFNEDSVLKDIYRMSESRTEFNIKDTSQYVYVIDSEYNYSNFYCYQTILPQLPYHELKLIMQKDLAKYFGLNARMEKRNRLCWVLSAEDTLLFKTKGGTENQDYDGINYRVTYNNIPFYNFRIYLEYVYLYYSPYPLVNEISTNEKIDMILDGLVENDMRGLAEILKKYKISLQLENRMIDVLVIDDPKSSN